MTNIAQIAREARVSKATVSRVVNRHPDVDPRTAERVGAVISRLGYVPRASAQALARGRARCIGLQVPTLTLPWLLELLRGIADAVESRGYTLTLYTTTRGTESLRNFAVQVAARVVDGLIVVVPHTLEDEVRHLSETDIPIISIDDHLWDVPVVLTTQYQGSYEATRHLIHQGRTPIATITGPLRSRGAYDRLDGFRDAARDAGIAEHETHVVNADWTIDGGSAAMRQLLDLRPDLSGLFAANDLMAIGAMSVIAESGRSIPGDIAVIGFDDIPAAAHTTPALTTVRQPLYEMGHAAALHLIDRLEGDEQQPQSITLPTSLVIRGSCGAVSPAAVPRQDVGPASVSPVSSASIPERSPPPDDPGDPFGVMTDAPTQRRNDAKRGFHDPFSPPNEPPDRAAGLRHDRPWPGLRPVRPRQPHRSTGCCQSRVLGHGLGTA